MASPSPRRATPTAPSTASPAIRPAPSGSRERGAGRGGAAEGSAPRSPLPNTTTSAGSGPRERAFATTSGPIPRGSPRVTARRGRGATALEADVHVGGASQQLEIVLLRESLAQGLADPILHVLEGELTLRQAPDELEHDEPRPHGPLRDGDHGLEARRGVVPDRLEEVGGELRNGQRVGELRLVGVVIAAGERGERRPRGGRTLRRGGGAPGGREPGRPEHGREPHAARPPPPPPPAPPPA